MNEKYVIELVYGTNDLPYVEPIPGAHLSAEKHGESFTIKGNSEGLLFLAQNLVALAKMQETPANAGYHIHIDDIYTINDENISFILQKL